MPQGDEIGRQKEKKILVPNSVPKQPELENSKKKAKKFKKLEKLSPALFICKTGRERPRRREKNFSPEFHSYTTREENSEKNSKNLKKFKNLFPALFIAKTE